MNRPIGDVDLLTVSVARIVVAVATRISDEERAKFEPEITQIVAAFDEANEAAMPLRTYAFPGDAANAMRLFLLEHLR